MLADTCSVTKLRAAVLGWSKLPRFVVLSGLSAGIVGGIVGLVVGLFTHPPTAWFAVFEVGVPAAFLGGIIGLLSGSAYLGFPALVPD